MKKIIVGLALSLALLPAITLAGTAVRYSVDGSDYEGLYYPSKENAPLILLVHDWDGLNDYEIKRSEMLVDMGYAVFAVDLFGAGVRPTEMDHMKALTGALYKDRSKMRDLMQGAVVAAKGQGANTSNAVAAGYCFGGAVVLEFARSGANMKGFVTFHGGLKTPDGQDYSAAKGSYLILHGSADKAIPMEQFAGLATELEAAGLPHEMVTYSGAPHAFTVFGSKRYREDADKKSWKQFGEFLSSTLD